MNHIEKIEAHLAHAKRKHPQFADELIYPRHNRELDLRTARWVIEGESEKPRNVFAESLLNCELAEVYEAIAAGRAEDAVEECYDACAVLLRMAEWIQEKGCGNPYCGSYYTIDPKACK